MVYFTNVPAVGFTVNLDMRNPSEAFNAPLGTSLSQTREAPENHSFVATDLYAEEMIAKGSGKAPADHANMPHAFTYPAFNINFSFPVSPPAPQTPPPQEAEKGSTGYALMNQKATDFNNLLITEGLRAAAETYNLRVFDREGTPFILPSDLSSHLNLRPDEAAAAINNLQRIINAQDGLNASETYRFLEHVKERTAQYANGEDMSNMRDVEENIQKYAAVYDKALSAVEEIPYLGITAFADNKGVRSFEVNGERIILPSDFGAWFGLSADEINVINNRLNLNVGDGLNAQEAYLFAEYVMRRTQPYADQAGMTPPPAPKSPPPPAPKGPNPVNIYHDWGALITQALNAFLQNLNAAGYLPDNFHYNRQGVTPPAAGTVPKGTPYQHRPGYVGGDAKVGAPPVIPGGLTILPHPPAHMAGRHHHAETLSANDNYPSYSIPTLGHGAPTYIIMPIMTAAGGGV